MKKILKIMSILLSVFVLMSVSVVAKSEDDIAARKADVPTIGFHAGSGLNVYSRESATATTSGDDILISGCAAGISQINGTNKIKSYGWTDTYDIVNNISVDLTLQKWVNGDWVSVVERMDEDFDADGIYLAFYRYVETGYYYRVVGFHDATNYDPFESDSDYTDSGYIWVD